jgi:hypothetical protein
MSLINEALKRAKQTQESSPAAASPVPHLARFQPVPSHSSHLGNSLLPPVTLGLVAMLGFIVIWQWIHMRSARVVPNPIRVVATEARTNTSRPVAPAPSPQPIVTAATVSSQSAQQVPVPVPPPDATKAIANEPPKAVTTPPASTRAGKVPANPAPAAKDSVAKPLVLKLQAIVTHPTRPSAVINGKSVFVGDHVSEFRVAKISRQNVTLVKAGKSTVLDLQQ